MRKTIRLLALGILPLVGWEAGTLRAQDPRAATPPASRADELLGLWKATRWFGPTARGPLIITHVRGAYSADMVGQRVPVRQDGQELAFDLANGQGKFRGKLESGGEIRGHWFPPPNMATFAGGVFASPVRLQPDGVNRWSGDVVPYDDVFTFFLLLQKRPDGSIRALLRNPNRDFGSWLGVRTLVREGNVVRLMGQRRGQPQETVVASGSYDSASSLITLSFPNRGGSYDFRRDDDQSEFYPRGRKPERYVYRPPPARADGWPTGTLDQVGIDRAGVESFIQTILDMPMDSASAPQIHGFLLARRGKLVLEEYFHGEHRDRLHDTRSATKSLTSLVAGAAIHAGAPLALSTPVYRLMSGGAFPPELEPRKRTTTLEHLLTMSSGFFCDDNNPDAPGSEERMMDQRDEPDYYRYTMAVPMAYAPGDTAIYCSANPHLALGMVGRATGESPMYTFDRLLGEPMRIHRYGWLLDPAGHPLGSGSVNLLPRDFLKLGQLMLNGGTWDGRRLLGSDYVARASSPLYRLGTRGYGYLWWGMDFPYRGRTLHAYAALGAGGNVVIVIPDLDTVIAIQAANYSTPIWRWGDAIPRDLLPAMY